jgi:hypothetical protein
MLIRRVARLGMLELERAQRGGGEVERGLGVAAPSQRVERPDHAGSTHVEVFQRQRLFPPVPFVRGPELVEIKRRVGVGDNRGDHVLDAGRNPRRVDQRLELRRLVEHCCGHRFLLVKSNCQLPTQINLGSQIPRRALGGRGREDRIN